MHLKLIVTLSLRSFLSSLLFSFWLDIIWNALGMFFCNSLYVGTYYGNFLETFTTYHLSSTCIQTSSLGFCRKIILCDLEAQIFLSYGMQSLFLFLSPFISLSFFFKKKHYVGSHLQVKSLILTNVLQLMKWWSMCWRYCRHEFVSSVVHKAFALYVISAFCFRLLNV